MTSRAVSLSTIFVFGNRIMEPFVKGKKIDVHRLQADANRLVSTQMVNVSIDHNYKNLLLWRPLWLVFPVHKDNCPAFVCSGKF